MPEVIDLPPATLDRRRLAFARTLALGTLGGGLLAVYTSYLAHRGYQHTAANLGIAVGLVGSILGAAQVWNLYSAPEPAPAAGGSSILPQRPDPLYALSGLPEHAPLRSAAVFGQAHRRKLAPA